MKAVTLRMLDWDESVVYRFFPQVFGWTEEFVALGQGAFVNVYVFGSEVPA